MATVRLSRSTDCLRGIWNEPTLGYVKYAFGTSRIASSAYQSMAHLELAFMHRFQLSKPESVPIQSLTIGEGNNFPRASHHLLYLTQLRISSSYPEGNFGGNQLLDGSMSLSPLYPNSSSDLHVNIDTNVHLGFPRLPSGRE